MIKWKNERKQTYSYSDRKLLNEIHTHGIQHSYLQRHNFMWHQHSSITRVGKFLQGTLNEKNRQKENIIFFSVCMVGITET